MNIQSLSISDCLDILLSRLGYPKEPILDESSDGTEIIPEPSQAELQAELEKYKSELIAAEEARIADLKSRYEALSDKGLIQGSLSISNPDLHFANLLQADPAEAEAGVIEMEEAYHSLLSELSRTSYIEQRQAEYAKIDNLLLEALAEQAEGRPERMVEYLALREQIKLQFPKPE